MKIIPQLFILIFFFLACTQEIDLPFPTTAPQIVLNGILHPDSLISITLTRTLPVADTGDFPVVTDAVVQLYEGDRLLGNLVFQDNAYRINYYPKAGYQYTIQADVPGYTRVTASDVIPEVPVAGVCHKADNNYAYADASFEITIQDSPSKANYYWLYATSTTYDYRLCKDIWGDTSCSDENLPRIYRGRAEYYQSYSSIPDRFNAFVDNTSGGVTQYDYYIRIEDASLDGTSISFNIAGSIYAYDSLWERSTLLHVINASQAYDRYLKSSIIYFLNNEYYDEANPFAEPTQIYSNVENGAGIFAAYSSVSIKVEDYPCE